MNRAIKRITKDIRDIYKNPLNDNNIYIHYDEDNIFKMYCMIIGTKDTPYENGYYLFDFTFNEEYPLKPPKVEYCTLSPTDNIRFNPNLYTCGKVCLSILNTWHGEQWSPVNTITTILLAIQSFVLIQEPLRNEPGFEECNDERMGDYDDIIYYENFKTSILSILERNDYRFEVFKPIMINHYIENFECILQNYDNYIEKIFTKYKKKENITMRAIYNMKIKPNFMSTRELLLSKYNLLMENQILNDENNK
jgi:ubiquitin-conjugating enzyme E2 O